jgi:hypothetical protein
MSVPPPPAPQAKGVIDSVTDSVAGLVQGTADALGLNKKNTTPPGVAPPPPGYTATGGRRRKTRKGRRATRKSTRRHRKGRKGGVVHDESEDLETALLHAKSELQPIPDYLRHAGYTRRHRKGKKGSRKH